MHRKALLTLTRRAADRIRTIMSERGLGSDTGASGLRISVEKGGCAGMSYRLDCVPHPDPNDEHFEDQGIRLYIESSALLFLLGARVDYASDELSSGFTFSNPNQLSACGCGESVALRAVPAEVLREALHRGQ